MPIILRTRVLALGYALSALDRGVHEHSENWGPEIEEYLANAGIHEAAPWCAALVQWCSDSVAWEHGEDNPLDAVKLEAYVQSYVDWAIANGKVIPPSEVRAGDLACFYHKKLGRYGHIAFCQGPISGTKVFKTVEGNTNKEGSREGTKVGEQTRRHAASNVYIRYDNRKVTAQFDTEAIVALKKHKVI